LQFITIIFRVFDWELTLICFLEQYGSPNAISDMKGGTMTQIEREITQEVFQEKESEEKHPSYEREREFYQLIAQGRTEQVKTRWDRGPKAYAKVRGVLSPNNLRNAMYHFVSMTAIVTRFCIQHGLDQVLAYKISDTYIQHADRLKTPEEILSLQKEMVVYFSECMAKNKSVKAHSKQIAICIEYINANLHSNLTVSHLAEKVNLNETYLSKLFKKEVGQTVSAYIRSKKITEACWLLQFTDKPSHVIAADLSFSSHSYFISTFRRVMNMTPKEYRNKISQIRQDSEL